MCIFFVFHCSHSSNLPRTCRYTRGDPIRPDSKPKRSRASSTSMTCSWSWSQKSQSQTVLVFSLVRPRGNDERSTDRPRLTHDQIAHIDRPSLVGLDRHWIVGISRLMMAVVDRGPQPHQPRNYLSRAYKSSCAVQRRCFAEPCTMLDAQWKIKVNVMTGSTDWDHTESIQDYFYF